MKKIIVSLTIGLIIGVIVTAGLFYDGYYAHGIFKWDWSLRDRNKNCLYIRTRNYENGATYREIFCVRNKYG